MTKIFFIFLVCYCPLVDSILPSTNFGRGIPDIDSTRIFFYLTVLSYVIETSTGKYSFHFNKWLNFIFFFSIISILSVFWSNYTYTTQIIQEFFNSVLIPFCIALIAINIFKEINFFKPYSLNLILVSIILSSLSVYQVFTGSQVFGGYVRGAATMGNPNALGIFLVLSLPLLIYSIEKKWLHIVFSIYSSAILLFGLLSTVSRKSIFTALLLLIVYFGVKKKHTALLLVCVFTLFTSAITLNLSLVSNRFSHEKMTVDITSKWNMTRAGLHMFVEKPILGHGYRGYYDNSKPYIGRKYDAHNMFITALTNYGLLGFIPFLGILFYPFIRSGKFLINQAEPHEDSKAHDLNIICFTSLIAFMLCGWFAGGIFKSPYILNVLYANVSASIAASANLSQTTTWS